MNARIDHLLQEVLILPADERSALAAALIDSLEEATDDAVSEAWRLELQSRRQRLRAGVSLPEPWIDVRARLSAM